LLLSVPNLHIFLSQEPKALTPSIVVTAENVHSLFSLESIHIATYLDKSPVTSPADYLTAVSTVLSMFWTFDVAFPKELEKTLSFLAGHVCGLVPFKVTPAILKVINYIYD
jgi:hypothetical protein